MRKPVDHARIQQVIAALGRAAARRVNIYFVGGVTSVINGWRDSTVDIDFMMLPEDDAIMRAIPALKNMLEVNMELAAPPQFIPVPAGWENRSRFIERVGHASFHHFDFYSQALAKLERGHTRDLVDVHAMRAACLIDGRILSLYFDEIEPRLYKFPAIDPASFRNAVSSFVSEAES